MGEIIDGIRQVATVKEAPAPDSTQTMVGELLNGIKQLVATQSSGNRSRARGPPPPIDEVQCYFCREMGHYRGDCRKYKQYIAGKQ